MNGSQRSGRSLSYKLIKWRSRTREFFSTFSSCYTFFLQRQKSSTTSSLKSKLVDLIAGAGVWYLKALGVIISGNVIWPSLKKFPNKRQVQMQPIWKNAKLSLTLSSLAPHAHGRNQLLFHFTTLSHLPKRKLAIMLPSVIVNFSTVWHQTSWSSEA